ncbi:Nitrogen assimilation transcription factor nit-4 [Cytospora mali]|uniref:Nitrogen assimilation transcription factor nit-4 n=1 Tax=Cytospora mali TaxID=578113 RepID=A0A194UMK8_CYTMA|nr:Nitrogen assimilation transcription factor nit-4 [Valsa mali var. pyri (nom. inval.)]
MEILRRENEVLKRMVEDSDGTIERLKTLPEDEALALFRRFRAAAGEGSNNNVITAGSIAAPLQTSLEFELMIRHPISYPVVALVDSPMLTVPEPIPRPSQPRDKDTSAYAVPYQRPSSLTQPSPPATERSDSQQLTPGWHSAPMLPGLCDDRLNHIEIRNWTQVAIPNELASRLISFYLTTDHPILGLFDADLFLRDLVDHKTDFCSPLLLDAVLCFACQGYTAIDADAAGLGDAFFVEAERLYREEKTGGPIYQLAITTIAAMQLLSATATYQGKDEVAHRYLTESIGLARSNGLIAVGKADSARNWTDDHMDLVRAASHTAWGTFCHATLHGMNYQSTHIRIPPWLPIPGSIIVRFEGPPVTFELPSYMGNSFPELCKLMPIINDILNNYYDHGDRIPPIVRASVGLNFAEQTYGKLLQWADSLPLYMARGDSMPHHAAIVHIHLHAAILDLFRPFLHGQPNQALKLSPFTAESKTPAAIYAASVNQLKHLILIFRTRYSCATTSILWHNALLYVANACLPLRPSSHQGTEQDHYQDHGQGQGQEQVGGGVWGENALWGDDRKRRIWFLACIAGYQDLAPRFDLVTKIVPSLLSIAILKRQMTAAEGRALMAQMKATTQRSSHQSCRVEEHIHDEMTGYQNAAAQLTGYQDGSSQPGYQDAASLLLDSVGPYGSSDLQIAPAFAVPDLVAPNSGSSPFVVDLNTASVNPSAASIDVLARTFHELAMFDEFMTGEVAIQQN